MRHTISYNANREVQTVHVFCLDEKCRRVIHVPDGAYCNFEGEVKCLGCGAMMEVEIEDGVLIRARHHLKNGARNRNLVKNNAEAFPQDQRVTLESARTSQRILESFLLEELFV